MDSLFGGLSLESFLSALQFEQDRTPDRARTSRFGSGVSIGGVSKAQAAGSRPTAYGMMGSMEIGARMMGNGIAESKINGENGDIPMDRSKNAGQASMMDNVSDKDATLMGDSMSSGGMKPEASAAAQRATAPEAQEVKGGSKIINELNNVKTKLYELSKGIDSVLAQNALFSSGVLIDQLVSFAQLKGSAENAGEKANFAVDIIRKITDQLTIAETNVSSETVKKNLNLLKDIFSEGAVAIGPESEALFMSGAGYMWGDVLERVYGAEAGD